MIKSPLWLSVSVAAFFVASCSDEPEATAANNAYSNYQASVRTAVANGVAESAEDRRKRLREKAKSDPDGADAEAIDNMSRNEVVATAINSAGFLCARVTSLQSVGGGQLLVDCTEYRNGTGRVGYRVDVNSGTVEQR